jgi:hypothetical protein
MMEQLPNNEPKISIFKRKKIFMLVAAVLVLALMIQF